MKRLPTSSYDQQSQTILVPRKRLRSLLMALFWLLATGCALLLCALIIRFNTAPSSSLPENILANWLPMLICLCFVLPGLFIASATLRFALARGPALRITHEGIWLARAFDPFVGAGDFIVWDQIQRLSLVYSGNWLFAVYPKNVAEYSAHYSSWKRSMLRHEITQSGYLSIAQVHVHTPLDEIIEQLSVLYAREIERSGVEIDAD